MGWRRIVNIIIATITKSRDSVAIAMELTQVVVAAGGADKDCGTTKCVDAPPIIMGILYSSTAAGTT